MDEIEMKTQAILALADRIANCHGMPILISRDAIPALQEAAAALRAAGPAEQHPDDVAVDRFAASMKEKLAAARAKGRGGWETCEPGTLSRMLRDHVSKDDPRDVANFCMMLWNIGAAIEDVPAEQQGAGDALAALEVAIGVATGTRVSLHLTRAKQLHAALAARQPVEQEPFGHALLDKDGHVVAVNRFTPDGQYVFTVADIVSHNESFTSAAPFTAQLIYAAPPAQAVPEDVQRDADEALDLLDYMFSSWEDGRPCTEDGERDGLSLGNAFRIGDEEHARIADLLNRLRPRDAARPQGEGVG